MSGIRYKDSTWVELTTTAKVELTMEDLFDLIEGLMAKENPDLKLVKVRAERLLEEANE